MLARQSSLQRAGCFQFDRLFAASGHIANSVAPRPSTAAQSERGNNTHRPGTVPHVPMELPNVRPKVTVTGLVPACNSREAVSYPAEEMPMSSSRGCSQQETRARCLWAPRALACAHPTVWPHLRPARCSKVGRQLHVACPVESAQHEWHSCGSISRPVPSQLRSATQQSRPQIGRARALAAVAARAAPPKPWNPSHQAAEIQIGLFTMLRWVGAACSQGRVARVRAGQRWVTWRGQRHWPASRHTPHLCGPPICTAVAAGTAPRPASGERGPHLGLAPCGSVLHRATRWLDRQFQMAVERTAGTSAWAAERSSCCRLPGAGDEMIKQTGRRIE